jgi:hypothetical protein
MASEPSWPVEIIMHRGFVERWGCSVAPAPQDQNRSLDLLITAALLKCTKKINLQIFTL